MKKLSKLLVLGVMALSVVGCSAGAQGAEQGVKSEAQTEAKTMTIAHKLGEVVVPVEPKSVAVFDFGVLDTLQALEVESVTGVVQDTTSRPKYLDEYGSKDYINIGGLKEPNFEALYELAPEIIFISGRQEPHYEELSKIAPVVFMEPNISDYMGSLESNVTLLGQIFGKEEKVDGMLEAIKTEVNTIAQKVQEEGSNALITMVNKGEVSVFGPVSRFGSIHNAFGFAPADTKIEDAKHGQVTTFEYLSKINPDYLFVVDRNALEENNNTAKDTLNNPLVNSMQAAQNNQIIYLDTFSWYVAPGGITATQTMIENIKQAINK